jgi:hypothetical protein
MNRPPAYQIYAKDIRSSQTVRRMTLAHQGVFFAFMNAAWDSEQPGTLPASPWEISKITGIDVRIVRKFLAKYPELYSESAGTLHIKILCQQYEELQQRKQAQSDAGKLGNEKRWRKSSGGDSGSDCSAPAVAPATTSANEKHTDNNHHHSAQNQPDDDDRIQKLFDEAQRILTEQGEERIFVEVALDFLDQRSLEVGKSPPVTVNWYLTSFRNLKHDSEAMDKIWMEMHRRRALREKYMLGFTGVPKNEAERQEFNRKTAKAGKPP